MTYLIKAFKVFDRGEKYKVFAVLVFSVCAAILEMIGITLALPVMTILLEGNLNSNYFQNFIIDFDFIERINKEDLLDKMIEFERNKQFEKFSQIYYNKIKLNTMINEN